MKVMLLPSSINSIHHHEGLTTSSLGFTIQHTTLMAPPEYKINAELQTAEKNKLKNKIKKPER